MIMVVRIKKPLKKKIGPPPKKAAPQIVSLTKKSSQERATITLKVSAEFRRKVKLYAASKDRSITDVLKSAFLEYQEKHN